MMCPPPLVVKVRYPGRKMYVQNVQHTMLYTVAIHVRSVTVRRLWLLSWSCSLDHFIKDTTFFGRLQTVASPITSKNSEHSPQFGAQSHLCLISAAKQKIRPRNLKIRLSSDHISTKTQTKVGPKLPILRSKSDLCKSTSI